MPIAVHVDGDVAACDDTVKRLRSLGEVVYTDGERALQSATTQSDTDWQGGAGDAFRGRLSGLRSGAQTLEGRIGELAAGLQTFADAIAGVKASMSHARDIANAGGVKTNDDWIADPDAVASDAERLRQTKAYSDANGVVADARKAEADAHTALKKVCGDVEKDAENLATKVFILALDSGVRTIEGLVDQARKWWDLADGNDKALAELRANIAKFAETVPFPDDMARRATYLSRQAADDVRDVSLRNLDILGAKIVDGKPVFGPIAKTVTANASHLFPEGSNMAKLAEKFPYLGTGLFAADTVYVLAGHEDLGDKAKDIGANAVSFATAPAVMTGLEAGGASLLEVLGASEAVAGWEGGPATAVGVAAVVAVGYGIDKLAHLF